MTVVAAFCAVDAATADGTHRLPPHPLIGRRLVGPALASEASESLVVNSSPTTVDGLAR
jgi:hypothetical protein